MKKINLFISIVLIMATFSCNNTTGTSGNEEVENYAEGTFGYDSAFLQQQDSGIVILRNGDGNSQVIISPKYQAKVFTSTAEGMSGQSFGWVNYKSFTGHADAHMNAYGGENRFWLGPEGGKYSLFFKPGTKMAFDNWHTPAAVDTEAWKTTTHDAQSVTMQKDMELLNYAGTTLSIAVRRKVSLLSRENIAQQLSVSLNDSVQVVGYETDNVITNTGTFDWTEKTGMPCIWILDMFNPSPETVIAVPFRPVTNKEEKIATTNYFGEIPTDRIKYTDSVLLFKADGKSRGKLGLSPLRAKGIAGSYDAGHHVLTLLTCDLDAQASYLNQEWDTVKPIFSGDAQNAYNDGPLEDGSQMGPFYELESVSPAAMLKAGESLSHRQSVFHFTGNEKALDDIAQAMLGISLDSIKNSFE